MTRFSDKEERDIDIRLLGPIECLRNGTAVALPGTSARAVLALLALRRRTVVLTDELVDGLWGQKIPADPTAALYVTVCRLRRALGADRGRLRRVSHGYRLDLDDDHVDVGRVESLLARGLEHLERDEPIEAEALLAGALNEWRHDAPLAELADLPFATTEASRLQQLRYDVIKAANDSSLRSGHPAEVVHRTEGFLGLDPWREDLVLQLMSALNATGRKADAFRVYARLASNLRAELGIEPSPEVQSLRNTLLGNSNHQADPMPLPAWFQASLEDLGAMEADPALRCRMMLALGEAEHHAGLEGWQGTLIRAGEIARAANDANTVARCALGGALGWTATPGRPDERRIQLMSYALEGDIDEELRVSLLGAYADELAFTADLTRRMQLTDTAVALARSAAKPVLLLRALNQRFNAIWAPETLETRRRDAAEACQLAEAAGDRRAAAVSAGYAMAAAMEAGDIAEVDDNLARFTGLAEELDLPVFRWGVLVHAGWRSAAASDLDRAEHLAEQARQYGAAHGRPEAELVYMAQRSALRWQQRRLGEEVEALAALASSLPAVPAFQAMHALALLRSGEEEQAHQLLEGAAIEKLPHDQMYLAGLMHWSEIASATGEVEIARGLYGLLVPYEDRFIFTGSAFYGPVASALALLARTCGDDPAADNHLREARRPLDGSQRLCR
jgi:DNA-binding SARP family transcriptional activator